MADASGDLIERAPVPAKANTSTLPHRRDDKGLVARIKTLVPEFEEAREERKKAKAAQKRAQTPKGQRQQP